MEQYCQFTGQTTDKMLEDLKPQAVNRIQTRLVLEAIAKAENIEISDEKLDEGDPEDGRGVQDGS